MVFAVSLGQRRNSGGGQPGKRRNLGRNLLVQRDPRLCEGLPFSAPSPGALGGQSAARSRSPRPMGSRRGARPQGYKRARAAESESGAAAAGTAAGLRPGCSRTIRMLRAPEPRLGQAGAVTQAKPLTSFLIQDILRDSSERRGSPTGSPQPRPPHQRATGRHPESEPQGRREDAGALEDDPSPQLGAAPREAESPAETEPGKPARPGRPGWPGLGPEEVEPPAGCAGVRAGPSRTSRSSGCTDEGPAGTGGGTALPPATDAPLMLTLSPSAQVAQAVDSPVWCSVLRRLLASRAQNPEGTQRHYPQSRWNPGSGTQPPRDF